MRCNICTYALYGVETSDALSGVAPIRVYPGRTKRL